MRKFLLVLIALTSSIGIAQVNARKVMIFGGLDHKTYLGCMNCSQSAPDSVSNKYGDHGSNIAPDSIFNRYGQFGGRFSDTSPCNRYATHPPVIVDGKGDYFGELTVNTFRSKRTESEIVQKWIAQVCED